MARRTYRNAVGSWGWMALAAIALAALGCGGAAPAEPWFGIAPPPGLGDPHEPVVNVSDIEVPPPLVPDGEAGHTELTGGRIRTDVQTITGFSRADRARGHRFWGRVTGFPAALEAVNWVAQQFKDAGLRDVAVQEYPGTAEIWWPRSWEVRLLADPSFGSGTSDVILESALPTSGSEITGGSITAALVNVGSVADDRLPDADVSGKVAVQRVRPESGVYSERTRTVERARELIARGAVAVFNVVEQTGNMHVRDFSNCNGPCFNLGAVDGAFLQAVMDRAAGAGVADGLRVRLSLEAGMLPDRTGHNAVGIVKGRRAENIVINAHADGWFDAAGDNADGLAVLVALARHFAAAADRLDRTLVFVASGGHHSPGLNGPSNFVRMNHELTATTVLVLNLEHIAQFHIRPGTWHADPAEQPMNFGISNEAPFIAAVATRARDRYGFNINPTFRAAVPGDLGGYASLGVPRVQAIHSGPMYHTSGDVPATISTPGLERAARFYAFFVREMARASRRDLDPNRN